MSLISFIKEAGEKLFNLGKPDAVATAAPADVAALNQKAADAILTYVKTQNLDVQNLAVAFDGASMTATVSGAAADQATREKVVLCCGNVDSVEKVNDQLTVTAASEASRFYTVKGGDSLSKISKEMYGDANKYDAIFEANKPMLKNPDRIYPGQVLRVPALA
ncbi:MAG: peptidoglycan-binding protein LysM [Gammaproteobacteria bacterium]|uniref:peptidoglycan-binding protein LysM n=1 Tax=Rhodoferax sp. TaxID=50421 RepID=UPI0017DFCDD5|nr:peptidoglycan-binding protein LysM [Rhodoferax sp.]MBU3897895.1 peptidoglycan-binding protein LysM [Gammaproteobacteria bacterium]MBA3057758.1 peptidoglycan-binding protein LysM [Rhodoferax sp.]MBU3998869.1 peptidoglycan-binding protein LysM [Gammaproteobacteria bacterium]MBU4019466.1 peptidoglycan-binding protein LysM [Gammaproteobacteria bacterium]MBU4080788.1 peptidoglycan-binding protein LysM [Gammaproteobacteria bacterium]